jgi:archaellum component FlaC
MSVSREKYERVKMAVLEWHKKYKKDIDEVNSEIERLNNELPINQEIIKTQRKEIKHLKKYIENIDKKYKDEISVLERNKILMEGKIQQLEEFRKDLQERYNDVKQDLREHQKK